MFAVLRYFKGKKGMVQKGRRVYVLFKAGELVGVWSNLKHLCNEMRAAGPFPSYSTLSKVDKEEGKIEFVKKGVAFVVYVEVVR